MPLNLPLNNDSERVPHMALNETDREDLMREASALVRRAELTVSSFDEPLIFGFRKDDSLSCYFGADPAYHFNNALQLKRAYVDEKLYRTQGNTLAKLTRQRTFNEATNKTRTELLRHDLESDELAAFLNELHNRFSCLYDSLIQNNFTLVQQVPTATESKLNLPEELQHALEKLLQDEIELAPRFKGKR